MTPCPAPFPLLCDSELPGAAVLVLNSTATEAWVRAGALLVQLIQSPEPAACAASAGYDVDAPLTCRNPKYPLGHAADSATACCDLCTSTAGCQAWVFDASDRHCWLLDCVTGTRAATDRTIGGPGLVAPGELALASDMGNL